MQELQGRELRESGRRASQPSLEPANYFMSMNRQAAKTMESRSRQNTKKRCNIGKGLSDETPDVPDETCPDLQIPTAHNIDTKLPRIELQRHRKCPIPNPNGNASGRGSCALGCALGCSALSLGSPDAAATLFALTVATFPTSNHHGAVHTCRYEAAATTLYNYIHTLTLM